jgi:tetratricopeptide (TPR) repeat protein
MSYQQYLDNAVEAFDSGHYREAVSQVDAMLATVDELARAGSPHGVPAAQIAHGHLLRGICFRYRRLFDAAEADLQACLRIDPTDPKARVQLGYVLYRLERDDEARSELEAVISLLQQRPADIDDVGDEGESRKVLDQAKSYLACLHYVRDEHDEVRKLLGDSSPF